MVVKGQFSVIYQRVIAILGVIQIILVLEYLSQYLTYQSSPLTVIASLSVIPHVYCDANIET